MIFEDKLIHVMTQLTPFHGYDDRVAQIWKLQFCRRRVEEFFCAFTVPWQTLKPFILLPHELNHCPNILRPQLCLSYLTRATTKLGRMG